jgi:antirestriction protein
MRAHYWELSLYNEGALVGRWFDLDGVTKEEHEAELLDWLKELSGKYDRLCEEIILGDVDGVPDSMHYEYGLKDELWDFMEFMESTNLAEEAVLGGFEYGIPLDKLNDAYMGEWESDADFAHYLMHDSGSVPEDLPAFITCHIDWAGVARDLMTEYVEVSGHYFSTNY